MTRKSLSDILHQGDRERLSQAWGETQAAEDFAPLPSGEYVARIVAGELFTSKTRGTAGYKLGFRVLEGEHQSRQFWHDVWLTPAALPMAKRDLAKIGVTALEQLERPLPPGIRCKVKLALRKDDDGSEYSRVKRFDVVGIDEPEADAFAPKDSPHPGPLPTNLRSVPGEGTTAKSLLPEGEGTRGPDSLPESEGRSSPEPLPAGDAAEPPPNVPVDTTFDPSTLTNETGGVAA